MELAVFAGVLFADLLSKGLVQSNGAKLAADPLHVIGTLVVFTYSENSGMAFGMFSGSEAGKWIFIAAVLLVVPIFGWFLFKNRGGNRLMRVAVALIIAGALGNFVDRIMMLTGAIGGVRDFIHMQAIAEVFPYLFFPTIFNIADMALTFGVILFAIYFILIYKDPKKPPKKDALGIEDPPEDNGESIKAHCEDIKTDGKDEK
jgi:signal peptidase II